jgi:uncharacterized protein (DUF1697 family)
MERIAQFLEHARGCMELAAKTQGTQSDALVRIAEYWTALARDRRRQLEAKDAPASVSCAYVNAPAPKHLSVH